MLLRSTQRMWDCGALPGFLWGHEETHRGAEKWSLYVFSCFQIRWKEVLKSNLQWWLRVCLPWSRQHSKYFTCIFTLSPHSNPMRCRYCSPHLRDEETKVPLTSFRRSRRLEEGPKIGLWTLRLQSLCKNIYVINSIYLLIWWAQMANLQNVVYSIKWNYFVSCCLEHLRHGIRNKYFL